VHIKQIYGFKAVAIKLHY